MDHFRDRDRRLDRASFAFRRSVLSALPTTEIAGAARDRAADGRALGRRDDRKAQDRSEAAARRAAEAGASQRPTVAVKRQDPELPKPPEPVEHPKRSVAPPANARTQGARGGEAVFAPPSRERQAARGHDERGRGEDGRRPCAAAAQGSLDAPGTVYRSAARGAAASIRPDDRTSANAVESARTSRPNRPRGKSDTNCRCAGSTPICATVKGHHPDSALDAERLQLLLHELRDPYSDGTYEQGSIPWPARWPSNVIADIERPGWHGPMPCPAPGYTLSFARGARRFSSSRCGTACTTLPAGPTRNRRTSRRAAVPGAGRAPRRARLASRRRGCPTGSVPRPSGSPGEAELVPHLGRLFGHERMQQDRQQAQAFAQIVEERCVELDVALVLVQVPRLAFVDLAVERGDQLPDRLRALRGSAAPGRARAPARRYRRSDRRVAIRRGCGHQPVAIAS